MDRYATSTRLLWVVLMLVGLAGCSLTPRAPAEAAFAHQASFYMQRMVANQAPVHATISLGEAMARALKYNLELRVRQDQTNLANAKLKLQHYSLLPEVVANSGYANRNSYQASTSLDLISNRLDSNPSTSQDRRQLNSDITIGWDILDFGVSYIRAQQAADEVLIAREIWRSTLHKMIEDVRIQYWRASTYQRLIERLKKLDRRTTAALDNSAKLSRGSQANRLAVLNSERELVRVKQAIKDLEQDLIAAKVELARLMNLKPGVEFAVKTDRPTHRHVIIQMPIDDLLELAVTKRPELRQNWYEHRINVKEAQANVLDLIPSLRGYLTYNMSSNSFLLTNGWASAGATMSWSLIKLFQYPAKRYAVATKQELLDRQALAMSMSVVTQVYLGLVRYDYFNEKLAMAEKYLSVQKRLTRQMQLEARASRVSEQELILEEMNELIAEAKYDIAYADVQKAYGGLIASIGLEFSPVLDPQAPLDQLAASLEAGWNGALDKHQGLTLISQAKSAGE